MADARLIELTDDERESLIRGLHDSGQHQAALAAANDDDDATTLEHPAITSMIKLRTFVAQPE